MLTANENFVIWVLVLEQFDRMWLRVLKKIPAKAIKTREKTRQHPSIPTKRVNVTVTL